MRRETWIVILLCADLGLVAALAYAWKNRPSGASSTDASLEENTTTTNVRRLFSSRAAASSANSAAATDASLPWHQLASRDLKQHVAKLRSAECPEETVKDIVLGEVNRLFASRERALKLRPEELQPWEVSPRFADNAFTIGRQVREIVYEKRAMLRDVLGYDVPVDYPTGFGGRYDRFDTALLNLPEGKRSAARVIMESFWNKQDEVQERTKGFWEADDLREQEKNARDRKDQLARLLTADEFLDFEIATAGNANSLKSRLAVFDATDKEFREIYRARMALDDVGRSYNSEDPEETRVWRDRYTAANQKVEGEIKALLGDERYADYQRSQDYQYRNLSQVAKQNGVDKQTINKAYDAQKFAQQEVQNLARNRDITPQQRTEMLKSMQVEYDKLMTGILGETAYQRYRDSGAYRIYAGDRSGGVTRTVITTPGGQTVIREVSRQP